MGIKSFLPQTMKGVMLWMIGLIVFVIGCFYTFAWASPLSLNDKDDVKEIQSLIIEDNDSIKLLTISPKGCFYGKDYQNVYCETWNDSVHECKMIMIEIEKKFWEYKCKGIIKP